MHILHSSFYRYRVKKIIEFYVEKLNRHFWPKWLESTRRHNNDLSTRKYERPRRTFHAAAVSLSSSTVSALLEFTETTHSKC